MRLNLVGVDKMVCEIPVPYYIPTTLSGLKEINTIGDGNSFNIFWQRAYPSSNSLAISYNIYYSTSQDTLFSEGAKFVSTDTVTLSETLFNFTPGQLYYWAVRATQFDPLVVDTATLPDPGGDNTDGYLKVYPETMLISNISTTDMLIPISDLDLFPNFGVIQIGVELIRYYGKVQSSSSLLAVERGYLNSAISIHNTDGFDGYFYRSPVITFWHGFEEQNTFIAQEQCKFDGTHEVYTLADGYKYYDAVGSLTTNMGGEEELREDFPEYDQVGWHRTDPSDLVNGVCLDTYIGGENFCADGQNGVNGQLRGIPLYYQLDRRQYLLLQQTGYQCVLLRRQWSGIVDSAYSNNQEAADPRSVNSFGTQLKTGYEQYFNPKESHGNVYIKFDPSTEDLKMEESGLELSVIYNCWTISTPTIRDRDVVIRLNPDGSEDARYEVLDVTRQVLFNGHTGSQKFRVQRIRKTDPIYQIRMISNTAMFPSKLTTGIGILRGPNNVPIPHVHEIVVNENIMSVSQINQTTSYAQGHNHEVRAGQIIASLSHLHSLTL
jgi:hypothetical protein